MTKKVVQDMLADLDFSGSKCSEKRTAVTIWVPAELKPVYEHIQKLTGNQMSKKLSALFVMAITEANDKAS